MQKCVAIHVLAGLVACALLPASLTSADAAERVGDGLQVLYTFDHAAQGVIVDKAPGVEPLNLRIDKLQTADVRLRRLAITSATTVASDGPASQLTAPLKTTNELTIEVWLKPEAATQTGPARIVTLSLDPSQRNFTLAQDMGRFEARLRTTTTDNNGLPSISTPTETVTTKLTHVVFTRAADGAARLLVDGQPVTSGDIAGTFENWDADFRLAVGNELTGDRPWLGELYLVAIYRRALSTEEARQNFNAGLPQAIDYATLLPPPHDGRVDFVKDIQPILRQHCYECHSADKEDGGLNLGMRNRALQGGDHGPVLLSGDSLNSRLIHLVAALDNQTVMPPDSDGLSRDEVSRLRAWIDQGAEWPAGTDISDPRVEQAKTHWAFQPLQMPNQPEVKNANWPKTAIDGFILAGLEKSGIEPAQLADARQLIRRLSFDLTGLPPTPQETAQYCNDAVQDRDAATESLIDRLLRSPRYGERWGRHWLDVARYADSDGQESDRDRPAAFRYRDFVIRAFNDDMPYDQFIQWQIAGDEYEPHNVEAVAATGFVSAGPFAALPDRLMEDERLRNRYNELDDILSTIGTGCLGLTLGCVRCHDHKYDAIPARDYYSMLSAFHGGERTEIEMGSASEKVYTYRDRGSEPKPTWLFQRGNYYDRDQPVSLGFISILTNRKSPDEYLKSARANSPAESSSKQRRALAEWMTDVDDGAGALLARVIVNRLWLHHFGQGLVRSVGDFGVRADAPTHPELLEWLARDLVTNGWRIKRLQRHIVSSAVYQQASHGAGLAVDPDNRLLWKMPMQRLEGEILRDSMLAVSGTLNLTTFGPAVKPPVAPEAMLARNLKDAYPDQIPDGPEQRRRSIYLFHKRVVPYPLLQAFDKPDAQQSCSRRDRTTVAPQALALLNDPFVRTVANEFADRLINEGEDLDHWIGQAYRLALARAPTDSEQLAARQFVTAQISERKKRQVEAADESLRKLAVADFCQVLFGLNEFLYVD